VSAIAERERRVAERHAQAGHWSAQSRPVFGAGKVSVTAAGSGDVTAVGGLGALHQLAVGVGLPGEIDSRLSLLKVHLPYFESDHVLTLAYNVAAGGTRLEDIERLRHDVGLMDALGAALIPDPTTAGDFCRRFSADDVSALMDAVNAARARVWGTPPAREMLGPVAYIDVDGTDAPTGGEKKEGIDISHKGVWGYAPLVIALANTKEVLFLVNRPGNVPSHDGSAPWIDKAIALVSPFAPRVCLRGDTDYYLTGHFDQWAEKVDFIFGVDANSAMVGNAEALDESEWTRLARKRRWRAKAGQSRAKRRNRKKQIVRERGYLNLELLGEDVAEFYHRPGKCARFYRVVAVRKNITRSEGELALITEYRYFFYVTTRMDLSPAQVVACANERCDSENVNEQLKNGVNALRVPLYDLVSNWAYMVAAALAMTLKSWFALMMRHETDRRDHIAMEYRRFFHELIAIPARVIRHARSVEIRLIGHTRSIGLLYDTASRIEHARYG
jgi:hypothetical protein